MKRSVLIVLTTLVVIWVFAFLIQKVAAAKEPTPGLTATWAPAGTITATWDDYFPPSTPGVIDTNEMASSSGCGHVYVARWKTRLYGSVGQLLATVDWRQGYCTSSYPHYDLTWVGKLRSNASIESWGDILGWEYRGVDSSRDGYYDGGFRHSSIKWLLFKDCTPIPTGKLCHTSWRLGRRMVVDGYGKNHLFAL